MSAAERIEAQAADWAARRDSGRWSETDQQALEAWIDESLAHRVAYLRLAESWERADRLVALRAPETPAPPARRWAEAPGRFSLQRMAAAFVLAVAAGGVWLGWPSGAEGDRYGTDIGGRESVSLADGTRLMLNTDSRVRSLVSGDTRTVWLERGEVYFDVAHDKARPFVVLAGDRRITVLGTKFSVRQFGDRVNVLVEDGRVRVEPSKAGVAPPTIVTRNDAMMADDSHVMVLKKTADQIANDLSWRQGKVVLDQLTLGEAAAEFNRYNRKKLIIMDAAAAQLRIGGTFELANVQGFAHLLHQGFGLVVRESGDEIRISS